MLFLNPFRWLLLLLLIPFHLMLRRLIEKGNSAASLVGLKPSSRRHPSIWPAVAAATLLVCALTRPYNGFNESRVIFPGRDILFLVDVSRSMDAADIHPNRLAVAKRKILDALDLSAEARRLDRFGIIVFSGRAFIYCPFTSDYQAIRAYVDGISSDLTSSRGTNIGKALAVAAETAEKGRNGIAEIVLLSDGEDPDLIPSEVLLPVLRSRLRVHVIGTGTPEGAPLRLINNEFAEDRSGHTVYSRLNEEKLSALSRDSDGMYLRARLDNLDIQSILPPDLPSSDTPLQIRVYNEFGPLFALAAMVLCVFYFRKSAILSAAIFITCVLCSGSAAAQSAGSLRDAYLLYQHGSFRESADIFGLHARRNPGNRRISRAFANALFKSGDLRQAAFIYQQLLQTSTNGHERFLLLYSLGNTLFALEEYNDAIIAYDQALRIKGGDEHARFNRDLARFHLDTRLQKNPPPLPGSENLRDSADSRSDTREPEQDQRTSPPDSGPAEGPQPFTSQAKPPGHVEELRFIPSEKGSSREEMAAAWVEALPDAPILAHKDKEAVNGDPPQWW